MAEKTELAKYLEDHGQSIRYLSMKTGITYPSLYRKVMGEVDYTRKNIRDISNALGFKPKDIIDIFFS